MGINAAGESACSICRTVLRPGQSIFETSIQFLPAEDPLSRYCDSSMHWDCYKKWHDRARFARKYFEFRVAGAGVDRYWKPAFQNDRALVVGNPESGDCGEVEIVLLETASRIRVPLEAWSAWLARPEKTGRRALHPVEREALIEIVPAIQAVLPDAETVLELVDTESDRCPICKKILREGQPIFDARGDFLPSGDPLHECGKDGMHWACYEKWEHRPRFARAYCDSRAAAEKCDRTQAKAFQNGGVMVIVNPFVGEYGEVEVFLTATGSRLVAAVEEWPAWLADPEAGGQLHPLERVALKEVLPALGSALPDENALLDALDGESKGWRR